MKRMEIILTIAAILVAGLQVGINQWSANVGSKNATDKLKKDLTKIFDTLNVKEREKFISNLNLNKEEIVLQVNKQTENSKKEIVSLVMPKLNNINTQLDLNAQSNKRQEEMLTITLKLLTSSSPSKIDSLLVELTGRNKKEVMEEARKIQKESESNYIKGLASQVIGDEKNAVKFYTQALENEMDGNLRINIFRGLGDIYRYNYDYPKSQEYYNKGLKAFSELEYKSLYSLQIYSDILNSLSILLMETAADKEDYEEPKKLLEVALKIDRDLLSYNIYELSLSNTLQNLGIAYKKLGEYGNAKTVLNEAFPLEEKFLVNRSAQNLKRISLTYENYAFILRDEKAGIDETLGFFQKAYDLSREALDVAQKEKLKDVDSYKVNFSALGMNFAKFLMAHFSSDIKKLNQAEVLLKSRQAILYNLWKNNKRKYGLELANTAVSQSALCIHKIGLSPGGKELKKNGLDYCRQAKNYLKVYSKNNPKVMEVLKRVNENESILNDFISFRYGY